jgi:hypothetical protein
MEPIDDNGREGSEPITIGWARTPIGTTGQVRTASACVS